jgi:hypothetical protein
MRQQQDYLDIGGAPGGGEARPERRVRRCAVETCVASASASATNAEASA